VLLPDHVHTIHYPHVAIHAQLSHLRISASYVALFVYKCGASSYTYIHTPIYFLTYTYLLVLSVIIHIRTNSFYTSLAMMRSLVHTYVYTTLSENHINSICSVIRRHFTSCYHHSCCTTIACYTETLLPSISALSITASKPSATASISQQGDKPTRTKVRCAQHQQLHQAQLQWTLACQCEYHH
jgi:hypothetical protein